jgi:heterotetrameric sarcosine oxidase delta subunit
MLLIPCPHCGPRDVTEFTYGGDANVRRPAAPGALSDAQWAEYIYLRDNPLGEHSELWQHAFGCRRWITVRRNTYTHDIYATGLPE